jgi:chemotaxis protein CheD
MSRAHGAFSVIRLRAGEMHYSDAPSLVITVLGSCLSVTMHIPRLGIGGICHGLLPACTGRKGCSGRCGEGFKYVDCSIRQMIGMFIKAGAKRSEIEVKYFGGADMFTRKIEKQGVISVGRQNIMSAEAVLKRAGLRIAKQDAGGLRGRKIYFFTHTGEVLLKRLTRVDVPDIRW